MKYVALVDHGLCNLHSIRRALEECGDHVVVTDRPGEVLSADRIVLPGVGSFADASRRLREHGLDRAIIEAVTQTKTPLLGICLGMQLLADVGEEGGEAEGLRLIPGRVVKFSSSGGVRVPHVGWNEVRAARTHPLLSGVSSGRDFYFVHSFHFQVENQQDVLSVTPYAGGFVSAVARGPVLGVQFHPEKSQAAGFQVLRGFLAF